MSSNEILSSAQPKSASDNQLPGTQKSLTLLPKNSLSTTTKTPIVDDNDVYIAVMGATGSGKSTFINLASKSNLRVGGGLESCTSIVQMAQAFELDGRSVTLIDTPGFDDTSKSDSDILQMIAAFLATGYEKGKRLAGVIYLHRISDIRMSGISTRNFKMFRQLCGESTLKNVVIVTNMWGEVSKEIGGAREQELMTKGIFFKPALDKGASLKRHENNPASAYKILRAIIDNHPLLLQIQRELVDEKKDISQTSAGRELTKEWEEQMEKHRKEMKKIQEEMTEAIRDKDEETKRELEIATAELQSKITQVQTEATGQVSKYKEEKEKLEERMQAFSKFTQEEAERAREEYTRQMASLQAQLADASSASATQRDELNRRIHELESRPSGGGCYVM